MMPFWPVEDADPVVDPERPDWDTWGPQMQARVIREKRGETERWK